MTIEDEIAALEKQIVAAKGQAYLKGLYARERDRPNRGVGGFLADLAILNREVGALEGERRAGTAKPSAPSAATPPAPNAPPDASAEILAQIFLALPDGGQQRKAFWNCHKSTLTIALETRALCGVIGSLGGGLGRRLQVEVAKMESAEPEPNEKAEDEAFAQYHNSLILAGHHRRAGYFYQDHKTRIDRAHRNAYRKND